MLARTLAIILYISILSNLYLAIRLAKKQASIARLKALLAVTDANIKTLYSYIEKKGCGKLCLLKQNNVESVQKINH